jgi:hypothetical protein
MYERSYELMPMRQEAQEIVLNSAGIH